jgi:hypothetical protein
MLSLRRQFFVFAAVVLAGLLGGCIEQPRMGAGTAETDDALYRRGKESLQLGRNEEALVAFLNLVEKRGGDAPESHLELGELYLVHVRDPIAAIYHYRKYRELKPTSPQADLVRQRIETATREFARSLPAQPLEGQVERLEMLEQIAALKRQNEAMRRELDARAEPMIPRDPAARTAPVANAPAQQPAPSGLQPRNQATVTEGPQRGNPPSVRRYTVQRGDNLFRIAEKVYGPGQGNRWREILAANRSTLPSENALQPGMELTIP